MIRKGAAPGSTVVFPEQGSETAELLPGDVIVTVRDKPHARFKREASSAKDLACVGPPLRRGDALYALRLRTLRGSEALLFGSPLAASLAANGAGGVVTAVLPGEGMPDPSDPWEHPPGDLTIRMLNPPAPPERRAIRCAARQRPLALLPSAHAVAAAAAAGAVAGIALHLEREGDEMAAEELVPPATSASSAAGVTGVILVVTHGAEYAGNASAAAESFASAATAALVRALRWRRIRVVVPDGAANAPQETLLDDEWAALAVARAVVLDYDTGGDADAPPTSDDDVACAERRICRAHAALAAHGVLDALWLRHWRGAAVAGVGAGGVALLGAAPPDARAAGGALPRALLPLPLRAGGGRAGWSALHAALAGSWGSCDDVSGAAEDTLVGAGVLLGSALSVDPAIWWQARRPAKRCSLHLQLRCVAPALTRMRIAHQPEGAAELLVAPPREVLVATAVAAASSALFCADEDGCGAYADAGFAAVATRDAACRALRAARAASF